MRWMPLLCGTFGLGAGCASSSGLSALSTDEPPSHSPALPHEGDDTGPDDDLPPQPVPPDPPLSTESVGAQNEDEIDAWLWSDEVIHSIELSLPAAGRSALDADPYTPVEVDVSIDGIAMASVGLRLRGKIGSFRTLNQKPKFEIDFNHVVSDQRFYGLESLSLNNEVVDCSYLKEPLSYRVFKEAGMASSRTGFATVSINGEDYGFYVLIETPDDRFLKRHFVEPQGNLYDGKYLWYGGWNYTLLDWNSGVDHLFPLEEGTDVANADMAAVSAEIDAAWGTDHYDEALGSLVNWEQVHTYLAVEYWLGHVDGYALNQNNWRFYFDPNDEGRGVFIPWDFDYAMLHPSSWGQSWTSPHGRLLAGCWLDTSCADAQITAIADMADLLEGVGLEAWFRQVDELTLDVAQADPRRECQASQIEPARQAVKQWVQDAHDRTTSEWGL